LKKGRDGYNKEDLEKFIETDVNEEYEDLYDEYTLGSEYGKREAKIKDYKILQERDKAIELKIPIGKGKKFRFPWVPKSLIKKGKDGSLSIPMWLAKKNRMVDLSFNNLKPEDKLKFMKKTKELEDRYGDIEFRGNEFDF